MNTPSKCQGSIKDDGLHAGNYSIKIPITAEGLLINIGPPNKLFGTLMSTFSCTFRGFRKFSDGSSGEVEKQQLIHENGDWIVEIEQHSTEHLTFTEVKELLKAKILEKRQMNVNELQLTFTSISYMLKKQRQESKRLQA